MAKNSRAKLSKMVDGFYKDKPKEVVDEFVQKRNNLYEKLEREVIAIEDFKGLSEVLSSKFWNHINTLTETIKDKLIDSINREVNSYFERFSVVSVCVDLPNHIPLYNVVLQNINFYAIDRENIFFDDVKTFKISMLSMFTVSELFTLYDLIYKHNTKIFETYPDDYLLYMN